MTAEISTSMHGLAATGREWELIGIGNGDGGFSKNQNILDLGSMGLEEPMGDGRLGLVEEEDLYEMVV